MRYVPIKSVLFFTLLGVLIITMLWDIYTERTVLTPLHFSIWLTHLDSLELTS